MNIDPNLLPIFYLLPCSSYYTENLFFQIISKVAFSCNSTKTESSFFSTPLACLEKCSSCADNFLRHYMDKEKEKTNMLISQLVSSLEIDCTKTLFVNDLTMTKINFPSDFKSKTIIRIIYSIAPIPDHNIINISDFKFICEKNQLVIPKPIEKPNKKIINAIMSLEL